MTRRYRYLLAIAVLALVAAACTDSRDDAGTDPEDATSSTEETTDGDEGDGTDDEAIVLVEPDPDPTPIEIDPAVTIGTLDNGLTYYLRSNQAPGGGLALRLVVNAGSLQQDEPESGHAHFLEHMLFNGTENFPGAELRQTLGRLGVEFGPDLNAYTSFDETVYELDLTAINDDKIETGFDVLADWASRATIAQADTEAERGVVREEIRLRDEGPDGVVTTAFLGAYLDGSPYEDTEPGGDAQEILATDAEDLREFYDRWYRPELMAIVAVGDLPVERMEEEIRDRFEGLESRSDGAERVEVEADPIADPFTAVVTHPEVAREFGSIDYSLTTWGQETVGGERLTLMQDLMALMIRNRLSDAADRGAADLGEPFVVRFAETRAHSFLGFNYEGADLVAATEYVLNEMVDLQRSGFEADELDRATDELGALLDQFLAGGRSTQDIQWADSYVAHYLDGSQISSVGSTHERLTGVLDGLDVAEVTDLFRWELAQAAPIVILVGSDPSSLPAEADLDAAVERSTADDRMPVIREAEQGIEALMDRPEPVEPVETRDVADPEATEWVFANGVTVRFVDSTIASGQVDLVAEAEGGWSALEPGPGALAPYAVAAVADSGLGEFDRVQVRRFLSARSSQLQPYLGETVEGFVGSAGVDDLEVLFQQLHLAVTAPRIDPLALDEVIGNADDSRRQVTADPGLATLQALNELVYGDDVRFGLLPPDDLDGLSADEALSIYADRFDDVDDLVVAIAGDVGEDEVAELAQAYLGSLPAGEPDTWADVRPDPLTTVVDRDVVAGTGEATGTVAVFYPSDVEVDAATRVEARLLEQIFSTRILDEVREELGASYGGQAIIETRTTPTDGLDVLLFANVDPGRGDEILDVVVAQATDLAANGVTADELDIARSIVQDDYELLDNNQLIDMLLTDPDEEVLTLGRRLELLAQVELADLAALAAQVLPTGVRAEVVTTPG